MQSNSPTGSWVRKCVGVGVSAVCVWGGVFGCSFECVSPSLFPLFFGAGVLRNDFVAGQDCTVNEMFGSPTMSMTPLRSPNPGPQA